MLLFGGKSFRYELGDHAADHVPEVVGPRYTDPVWHADALEFAFTDSHDTRLLRKLRLATDYISILDILSRDATPHVRTLCFRCFFPLLLSLSVG
jgi:hypothetical protein